VKSLLAPTHGGPHPTRPQFGAYLKADYDKSGVAIRGRPSNRAAVVNLECEHRAGAEASSVEAVHGAQPVVPELSGLTYAMVLRVVIAYRRRGARFTTWRIVRADREAELLFRGQAYRQRHREFYQSNGAFPRSLEDLPKDPRRRAKGTFVRSIRPGGQGEKRSGGSFKQVEVFRAWPARAGRTAQAGEFSEGVRKVHRREVVYRMGLRVRPSAASTDTDPGAKPPGASPPVLRTS